MQNYLKDQACFLNTCLCSCAEDPVASACRLVWTQGTQEAQVNLVWIR